MKIADEEVSKIVHQKAAAFTNTINRAVNNMLAFGRKLGTNADLWKNGAASHTCSWRRPSLQLHLVIMMRTLTPVNGKKTQLQYLFHINAACKQTTCFHTNLIYKWYLNIWVSHDVCKKEIFWRLSRRKNTISRSYWQGSFISTFIFYMINKKSAKWSSVWLQRCAEWQGQVRIR